MTLIEMMVVVVIVGTLAAAAYWGFSGVVPAYRLNVAARDVASLLAVTRAKAIAQNRYYIVWFRATDYQVIWDKASFGTIDPGDEVTETGAYGQGVTYQRPTSGALTNDTVAFTPSGIASNISPDGQSVQLTNAPGKTRDIQVRYSGLVKTLQP